MARLSSCALLGVLLFALWMAGSVSGAMNLSSSRDVSTSRQAPSSSSTSLVAATTASVGSLRKILLPALQSLIGAPLQLLRQLVIDLSNYIRTHPLSELYSMRTIELIGSRLPDRVRTYWVMLAEMESQCVHRTLCGLADFASQRMPKWAEQISLIYLNAFSGAHPYYQAMINGLTNHQCKAVYGECDAQGFLTRVRGNLSESFSATAAPVKEAFEGLVNATLSSLSVDKPAAPSPALVSRPSAAANNGRINAGPSAAEDEEEEFNVNDEFARRPSGRFSPQDTMRMMPLPPQTNRHFDNFAGPMLPPIAAHQPAMRRPQGPFPRH